MVGMWPATSKIGFLLFWLYSEEWKLCLFLLFLLLFLSFCLWWNSKVVYIVFHRRCKSDSTVRVWWICVHHVTQICPVCSSESYKGIRVSDITRGDYSSTHFPKRPYKCTVQIFGWLDGYGCANKTLSIRGTVWFPLKNISLMFSTPWMPTIN